MLSFIEDQIFTKNHLDQDIVRSLVDLFKKDFPGLAFQFYELGLQLEYYPRQQVNLGMSMLSVLEIIVGIRVPKMVGIQMVENYISKMWGKVTYEWGKLFYKILVLVLMEFIFELSNVLNTY